MWGAWMNGWMRSRTKGIQKVADSITMSGNEAMRMKRGMPQRFGCQSLRNIEEMVALRNQYLDVDPTCGIDINPVSGAQGEAVVSHRVCRPKQSSV